MMVSPLPCKHRSERHSPLQASPEISLNVLSSCIANCTEPSSLRDRIHISMTVGAL